MANVNTVKKDIESLPPSDVTEIKRWLDQQSADQPIDLQLKTDLQAGKLDELLNNAIAEDAAGKTTPL